MSRCYFSQTLDTNIPIPRERHSRHWPTVVSLNFVKFREISLFDCYKSQTRRQSNVRPRVEVAKSKLLETTGGYSSGRSIDSSANRTFGALGEDVARYREPSRRRSARSDFASRPIPRRDINLDTNEIFLYASRVYLFVRLACNAAASSPGPAFPRFACGIFNRRVFFRVHGNASRRRKDSPRSTPG